MLSPSPCSRKTGVARWARWPSGLTLAMCCEVARVALGDHVSRDGGGGVHQLLGFGQLRGRQPGERGAFGWNVFVEMIAQHEPHSIAVWGGDEVVEVLVLQHQRAVFVRRKNLCAAARAKGAAGEVVVGDAGHLIF